MSVDFTKHFPGGYKLPVGYKPRPMDSGKKSGAYETEDPRPAFMDEMRGYGFQLDDRRGLPTVPEIGHIVRIKAPDDKPGKKSGWYWYSEFSDDFRPGASIGVGVFGSWKGNPERVLWTSKRRDSMSNAESIRMDEQIAAQKIARDAEIAEDRRRATELATAIWLAAKYATADYPYIQAKGIEPGLLRIHEGRAVVPVKKDGAVVSLQFISPDGSKKFLTGGQVKGCYCPLGFMPKAERVYICEGYATGSTIHEATGDTVYVAFNAGNLSDVTDAVRDLHKDAEIIVAGDDDHHTDGNPGRAKATAAADVHRCKSVFPEFDDSAGEGDTDFNDMARLYGIDAVRDILTARAVVYEHKTEFDTMPDRLLSPPGILGDIVAYYNATARAPQPGFAVTAALAIGSIVCARNYRTSENNFSSLYFLNVAKSGTGKEHVKTVIEDVLRASEVDEWINGSGYTSAGAVFSTVLRRPKHVTIIDEFGRYLEAANGGKNTNLLEANTQLMEAIGRTHGVMRPTAYSTMTLTKEKAEELSNRKCENPAITLIGMTTPVALYNNLKSNSVSDGFLGRFLILQSNIPRMVHATKGLIDVPHRISDWVGKITARCGYDPATILSSEAPAFVTLSFTGPALRELREFDQYRVDMCNQLETAGLEALPGRSKEMAMRLAMICALAENPNATTIEDTHAHWAIEYVRFGLEQTISVLKMSISGSKYEADKKEVLQAIREAGEKGVTHAEMQKTPPFSKHKKKDLTPILTALTEGEQITLQKFPPGPKGGRPREAYIGVQ